VEDILAQRPLAEGRLEALREFTRTLVEERGWAKDEAVNKFIATGFTKAQVFEVVMGIALKTLTNYSNHLADAQPNPEFTGGSTEPANKESVR
jgi:alkylhydroperoxidase family enzyme